jgi:hypothetical protein
MIKECLVHTDIMFDHESLKHFGFDLLNLAQFLKKEGVDVEARGFDIEALKGATEVAKEQIYEEDSAIAQPNHEPRFHGLASVRTVISNAVHRAKARADSLARIWDQLVEARSWWVLEFIPMLATYQEGDGTWIRRRM